MPPPRRRSIEVIRPCEHPRAANKEANRITLQAELETKKETREKAQAPNGTRCRSGSTAGVGGGLNIQAMRKGLEPQKETLSKVNVHLERNVRSKDLDDPDA